MEDSVVYSVIMTEYLAGGGDKYTVISEHKERQLQGPLDTDILQEYLKMESPIKTQVEKRISLDTIHHQAYSGTRSLEMQFTLLLSLLLYYTCIIAHDWVPTFLI